MARQQAANVSLFAHASLKTVVNWLEKAFLHQAQPSNSLPHTQPSMLACNVNCFQSYTTTPTLGRAASAT
jgi:hypothetical protein